jgi:hypothetical protein
MLRIEKVREQDLQIAAAPVEAAASFLPVANRSHRAKLFSAFEDEREINPLSLAGHFRRCFLSALSV